MKIFARYCVDFLDSDFLIFDSIQEVPSLRETDVLTFFKLRSRSSEFRMFRFYATKLIVFLEIRFRGFELHLTYESGSADFTHILY